MKSVVGLTAVAAVAVLSGARAAAAAMACDAACLDRLVDRYFVALVAHDPSRVSIAPGAKFVEAR